MAHLTKRGKKWYGVFYLGSGKYSWIPLHEDEEEAKKMALEIEPRAGAGSSTTLSQDKQRTMASFLDEWLNHYVSISLKPTTIDSYTMLVNYHWKDAFGEVLLQDFTPLMFQKYMADKLRSGLSPTTVRYHRQILIGALDVAVDSNYIEKNPVRATRPPQSVEPDMPVWEPEQSAKFLWEVRNHRLFPLVATALLTGLRRGEILGLLWRNVDLENLRINITQTVVYANNRVVVQPSTKTRKGRRFVSIGMGLASILADHRRRQREARKTPRYRDRGYVFPNRFGGPIDPHNFSGKMWPNLVKSVEEVPYIPFHSLRHSHLSDMVAAGINLRIISERGGHASVDFTQRRYVKVSDSVHKQAAQKVEDMILGQLESFATHLQPEDGEPSETGL